MLTHLSINNYALINQLSIDFTDGLSIITGETGAGKSILLGALGLVMGNRADLSSLKDTQKKCFIEAKFSLKGYELSTFFEEFDLDYEDETIIRREILPSGKSRAFVNDTPVLISVLSQLKIRLVDIHSQHQTLKLSDEGFQYSILDALSKNNAKVASYKRGLVKYNALKKALRSLKDEAQKSNEQYEYNVHLFNELEEANLRIDEQQFLEEKLEKLNNIEEIKQNLSESLHIVSNEEIGVYSQLNSLESKLQKINGYSSEYKDLFSRITSVKIELDDVLSELEFENEKIDFNPIEIEELNDRLQLIYSLQKKHSVVSIYELQAIHETLREKVAQVEGVSDIIQNKENEIREVENKLNDLAKIITNNRSKAIAPLKKQLKYLLTELGMPHSQFQIEVTSSETFNHYGKDQLCFLFSANKGGNFGELKKVASGGELSRIMLSIKNILSKNVQLPTIIFDEIDTGVSGEVSNKIASIMDDMATNMQVITITHLPQIASQGKQHYKVYKEVKEGVTTSNLKLLNYNDRVNEIAEMLSGKDYSESALNHAKELLTK